MVAYLDSSVILQHILKGDEGVKQAFSCDSVVTGAITEIECRRVIHRYRMDGKLDDDRFLEAMERLDSVLSGISVISLSDWVQKRAGQAFPVTIKTLDALHLSSAELYRDRNPDETLTVFSYDRAFNRCSRAMEMKTPFSDQL